MSAILGETSLPRALMDDGQWCCAPRCQARPPSRPRQCRSSCEIMIFRNRVESGGRVYRACRIARGVTLGA